MTTIATCAMHQMVIGTTYEVNVSCNPDEPYWQAVAGITVGCDDATAADYDCDGCDYTVHLLPGVDSDPSCPDPTAWHMTAAAAMAAEFRRI